MLRQLKDGMLALTGGALLAMMIDCNSQLALHTSSVFSSWVAHGVGAVVALMLVRFSAQLALGRVCEPPSKAPSPLWFYLGGIPGAFTVILAALAVNGRLSLSGAIWPHTAYAPLPLSAYLGGFFGALFVAVNSDVFIRLGAMKAVLLVIGGQMLFAVLIDLQHQQQAPGLLRCQRTGSWSRPRRRHLFLSETADSVIDNPSVFWISLNTGSLLLQQARRIGRHVNHWIGSYEIPNIPTLALTRLCPGFGPGTG
jgi:uncharacterized membrane protein YdcZ (DUF606 family)